MFASPEGIVAILQADAADGSPQPGMWLDRLIAGGQAALPLPGGGQTLHRWRCLAAVAQFDLSLAKLYEGHTDALATLAELEPGTAPPAGSWCLWAAESPPNRVTYEPAGEGAVRLSGRKHWCSGALSADRALLTVWTASGQGPQLVQVALAQTGVATDASAWKAVGMSASQSVQVQFDGAIAQLIGLPGAYLSRPGFWHGGAGIAACWYGGALALADKLLATLGKTPGVIPPDLKLASLGRVQLSLAQTAALLRATAQQSDDNPLADAQALALTARLSAEQCARIVLEEAGKALGAGAFCLDAGFARMAADLPVFIRQSHGDKDFAALGQCALQEGQSPWAL